MGGPDNHERGNCGNSDDVGRCYLYISMKIAMLLDAFDFFGKIAVYFTHIRKEYPLSGSLPLAVYYKECDACKTHADEAVL
jgi:hypothetical protein